MATGMISKGLADEMLCWRRELHQCPELGFDVPETAAYIGQKLHAMGIEVHTGIGQSGIVGVLKKGGGERAIGLRADMDALKISELNTFDYASKTDGQMHACGHDGHSAMLLGAAKALCEAEFSGTVYFIFQPNEEHGLGAQAMVEDGLFERFPMQAVYGLHNMPGRPAGQLALKEGPIMAGEDNFVIEIKGRGGHASQPQHHIDPLVVSAEIILALQTIVARSIDPFNPAVVSVTEIEADGTVNVVPSNVVIKGDCRSFTADVSQAIEQRMTQLCSGIGLAHGAEVALSYHRVFRATSNSLTETEHCYAAAKATQSEQMVEYPCEPMMASEDFAHMLLVKPGCYAFIGNGMESEGGCVLHNPHYDFNDEILVTGASYWINLVQQRLP